MGQLDVAGGYLAAWPGGIEANPVLSVPILGPGVIVKGAFMVDETACQASRNVAGAQNRCRQNRIVATDPLLGLKHFAGVPQHPYPRIWLHEPVHVLLNALSALIDVWRVSDHFVRKGGKVSRLARNIESRRGVGRFLLGGLADSGFRLRIWQDGM